MQRYHKFISVIWNVAFLVMLQELSVPRPVFRYLVAGFLLFVLLLTAYNWMYLQSLQKWNIHSLIRPVLFFGSAFLLFQVIPADFLRSLFLVVVVILGTIIEYFLGVFAEGLLLNETLVISFGVFMSICAYAFQYFPTFQTFYLGVVFLLTALVARGFFEFTPEEGQKKIAASVIIALFCTEVFWALSFLPLHFSSAALMLFNVFYFALILQYYFIFNTLNVRKMQFHIVLLAACSIFIFLITPWKILVN